MKMIKRFAAFMIALTMAGSLAACNSGDAGDNQNSDDSDNMTYAVEAGSAGEAAAKEKGYAYNTVTSQADTLMEVAAGTSDAAIIDLLMAGAMIGEGTSYPDLITTDSLTEEFYGIGCRKGSDLVGFINNALAELYADGTMASLAETYGIAADALVPQKGPDASYTPTENGDLAYIKEKGTLVVGITEFAPMDYRDKNGNWVGFDADLAKAVGEKLGVAIQFVVIDWDVKIMELNSKNIDIVWNGMTLTDEVTSSMDCTNAYCKNAQVIVVPAK